MDTLDDKDVGELWRKLNDELTCDEEWANKRFHQREIGIPLIRKLVETEAHVIWLKSDKGLTKAFFADAYFQQCREEACCKFNIDPATYPRVRSD